MSHIKLSINQGGNIDTLCSLDDNKPVLSRDGDKPDKEISNILIEAYELIKNAIEKGGTT